METLIIIAGGIILLAIIIGLGIIFRRKKRHRAIIHYERVRDKLSVREPEPEPELDAVVDEFEGGLNLASLMTAIITMGVIICVATMIMGSLSEVLETQGASNSTTALTESFAAMSNILPLLFFIVILALVMGVALTIFGSFANDPDGTTYEEAKDGIDRYKETRDKLSAGQNKKTKDKYVSDLVEKGASLNSIMDNIDIKCKEVKQT